MNNKLHGLAYINNKFIDTDKKISINSAIDGTEIGSISALNKEQIDFAFESAHKAFYKWSFLNSDQRIEYILKFAEFFLEDKEIIANLITKEIGKSYPDALTEVIRSYEYIIATVEMYKKELVNPMIYDDSIHGIKNKIGKFYHVPIGVVLAISPFNYPINLSIAKIIPTLLVGNTIVFKPATYGSLVCSLIAKYFDKANFPEGVFNLVMGKGSEIGDYILTNKRIEGVTFTGSTDIGKKIAKALPAKNIVLELGGKDAAIVLEDIDIKKVAKEIVKGAFNFSGQRCTAIKRVIVLDSIADNLVEELKNNVLDLKIGNPFDGVDIIPLIDNKSLNYVLDLINDAITHNANVITGNKVVGYNLLEATLVDNVSTKSRLAWEEPFGPVLPVIRVKTIQEAISITNASNFGLQASIFTNNVEKAKLIARYLNVGTVNINKSPSRGPDIFPFIGVKDSGFGVQGIVDSLKAMTRIKGIVENN